MSDTVQTKMRNHPLAPKHPNIPVPAPATPTPTVVQPPAFQIPAQGQENTLASLVALSKGGNEVPVPVAREMTNAEREALLQGKAPSSTLTSTERSVLMKLGWQEGEPIPTGLADELNTVRKKYIEQKRAEGIPMDQIKPIRIEDLPAEEQERLRGSIRSMIESIKSAPPPSEPTINPNAPGYIGVLSNTRLPEAVQAALAEKAEEAQITNGDNSTGARFSHGGNSYQQKFL